MLIRESQAETKAYNGCEAANQDELQMDEVFQDPYVFYKNCGRGQSRVYIDPDGDKTCPRTWLQAPAFEMPEESMRSMDSFSLGDQHGNAHAHDHGNLRAA